ALRRAPEPAHLHALGRGLGDASGRRARAVRGAREQLTGEGRRRGPKCAAVLAQRGSRSRTQAPPVGPLPASTPPPWASAITRTIERPSPAPGPVGLPRLKRSNARSRKAGAKPSPPSSTRSSMRPFAPAAHRVTGP